MYLEQFYRDVAGFVLGFVTISLEICFSPQQRKDAIDAFFDVSHVPAMKVVDVLVTMLANTSLTSTQGTIAEGPDHSEEDAKVTIQQCVRQLELAIHAGALDAIVEAMLAREVRASSLCAGIHGYAISMWKLTQCIIRMPCKF